MAAADSWAMEASTGTAWPLPTPPSSAGGHGARAGPAATALPGTPPRLAGRISGIDAARAVAIVGMVAVHVGPADVDVSTAAGWWYELPHGRSSILFILLAGVGVSLLAGDRSPARRERARTALVVRAAVLLPMGLALQALGTRVAVILAYYAIYFLVALALIRLRDRALLAFALAWSIVGPVLYLAVVTAEPAWFPRGAQPGLDDPLALARVLLLTGYYPTVVWAAPLAFGMWLGRRDLRATRTRVLMLGGGAAVAAASYLAADTLTGLAGTPGRRVPSWELLAIAEPHSEMPLWVLGATGVATAVLALFLVLCDRWPRATWPLVATGQLALTVYVGHILVIAAAPELLVRSEVGAAAASVVRLTVVAVAASTLWRAYLPRGPVEWLVRLPTQALLPRR